MKQLTSKLENFNRIEFWVATAIFVFLIFFHITHALPGNFSSSTRVGPNSTPFNYYFVANLITYVILYLSFIFLNFYVVPKLLRKENLVLNIFSVILVLVIVAIVFGASGSYLLYEVFRQDMETKQPYYIVYQKSILYAAWLLLVFGFYTVIRYSSIYLISHAEEIQEKYKFVKPGTVVAFVIWMITLFLILVSGIGDELSAIWAIVVLFSIFLYNYSFHSLIPNSFAKKKPFRAFMGRTVLVLLISFLPVFLIGSLLTLDTEGGAAISSFNAIFQLFLIAPISWILFKRHLKGNEMIYSLKKELGRSYANLDFLRSQINPHFLFNALNTIYGTAIQEGAERTSSGVEKLGDMMRFMLQENMQEKIPLSREIEYLDNYISFQKLRTETKTEISIRADIQQEVGLVQIAPMLLIPFVENAFKHGISFREASYINITMEMKGQVLHFDVSNSKHPQLANDPEQGKSGIGLENVRQRLALIYPGKHELVTRETIKDFFVHLTLQLS